MTEAEWLACTKLELMLALLKCPNRKPGSRKLRLFACACCRRLWPRLKGNRRAVVATERFVDRLVTAKELAAFASAVTGTSFAAKAVQEVCGPTARFLYSGAYLTSLFVRLAVRQGRGKPQQASLDRQERKEESFQVNLLRDIVGNPFRPVTAEAAWLTPTVVPLARAAYEKRHSSGELDPERLAVLADALEDAGATGDLLKHLRGPGTHFRGCWALDLLLGKQ
jgi:hypothetical protein